MTYVTTDKRRVTQIGELPVKDSVMANYLSSRPVSEVDSEVELYQPEPKEEVKYNLAPLKMHFGEFLRHHATAKDSGGWLKQFKGLLPGVVGDAGLMVMGDLPVATFRRDARLSLSRLEKEQPQIIAKYTRMVTKEAFDEDAFKRDMPDVHAAYRGRSFRLVNAGSAAGLVLPA
jgi:hypothetical protein